MNIKKEISQPAVTIVVPVYQVAEFIEVCAVSLFEQDCANLEFVFVDDACSDGSMNILEQVLQRYPERIDSVKIIRNSKNVGPFQARKIGTLKAGGEYVQYVDADDWIEKDMVSSMYQAAKSAAAELVSCDFVVEAKSGKKHIKLQYPNSGEQLLEALLWGNINMSIWNKLIKRKTLVELYQHLNIRRSVYMAEDWLISIPLYNSKLKMAHVPRAMYHYNRTNLNSLSVQMRSWLHSDNSFVMGFLHNFLGSSLDTSRLQLLTERLALGVFGFAFSRMRTPDYGLLQELNFKLSVLWCSKCATLYQKGIYSFYFLRILWVPKIVQKLRRRIKR